MEHFITLFDSVFLPQGLALHHSLEKHAGSYTLWVLCMDAEVEEVLEKLNKPNLKTISLADVEKAYPELLSIKEGRTKGEYCWTLTPFTPKLVFERDTSAQRVTYVDADLFVLKDISPILQEFENSGKAVLITEHGYAPEYDQSDRSGKYCVQFMTFIRDVSEPVRACWENQCIDWCFARHENGKFGDQKYLDAWPEKFEALVHILTHPEWTLAPWNISQFSHNAGKFFHFHDLRLFDSEHIHIGYWGFYNLYQQLLTDVYSPYQLALKEGIKSIQDVDCSIKHQTPTHNLRIQQKIYVYLYRTTITLFRFLPFNILESLLHKLSMVTPLKVIPL